MNDIIKSDADKSTNTEEANQQPNNSSSQNEVPDTKTDTGIDNTQPEGTNPIGNFSVEYLGEQKASNSCSRRDLGFAGHIQGKWYAVYGDTLWGPPGVSDPDHITTSDFHGMVRDSVSALTDDPLVVHDLNLNGDHPVPHQKQFIPHNEEWGETHTFGFGGTSLVETDYESATAAVYFLIVSTMMSSFNLRVQGDDDHIIVIIATNNNALTQSTHRTTTKTTPTPETAVMWGVGQGQIVYSNYFNCYIYVHLSTFCHIPFVLPLSSCSHLLPYIHCSSHPNLPTL